MESFVAEPEEETSAERAIKALNLYYLPFLVFAGSAGNLLSFAVIRSSEHLRRLSASVYLCSLAISDTVFLIIMLLNWLTYLNEKPPEYQSDDLEVENHEGTKEDDGRSSWIESLFRGALFPYVVYITNVSTFLSAWLVFAFTAERFVAVRYPLKRASMCTTRRARLVLSVIVIFSFAAYIPWIFIAEPGTPSQESEKFDLKNETFASNGSVENEGFQNVSQQSAWDNDWTIFFEEEGIHSGRNVNVKANVTATIGIDDGNETSTVIEDYDGNDFIQTHNNLFGEVLNIMDVVLAFVVPCLGIAALNICIAYSMMSAVKWQDNREKSGCFKSTKRNQLTRKTSSFAEWRSSYSKCTTNVAIETAETSQADEVSPSVISRIPSSSKQKSPSNFDQTPTPVQSVPSSPSGGISGSAVAEWRSSYSKCTTNVAIETAETSQADEVSPSVISRIPSSSKQKSPSNFDQTPTPVQSVPLSPSGGISGSAVAEWRSSYSKCTTNVAIETAETSQADEVSPSAISRIPSSSKQKSPSNFDQPPTPVQSVPSSPSGGISGSAVAKYPTCLPGQNPCFIRSSNKRNDGNQNSRSHMKITGMLLVVSTVFLVLNAPSYVVRAIVHRTITQNPSAATNHLVIPQRFADYLFYTNFGINFVLYCVFGRNFRRALRTLIFSKFLSRFCRVYWSEKYSSVSLNGGKTALSGGRTTKDGSRRRRRKSTMRSSSDVDGKRSSWVISDWSRRSTLFSWVASMSEVKGETEEESRANGRQRNCQISK